MINVIFSSCTIGALKTANSCQIKNKKIIDSSSSLFCINLELDKGHISDNGTGNVRRNFFQKLSSREEFSEQYDKMFNNVLSTLRNLEKLLKQDEKIRIWYSDAPNEFCGFCWLIALINLWNIKNDRIIYVKLPGSILDKNGEYTTYDGSWCFGPEELAGLEITQKHLTESYKKFHIEQWERAKRENTPLRITLNGQIISVYEDFYDSIILRESEKQKEIFDESSLISSVLKKIPVTGEFVENRIEAMIDTGIFDVVDKKKHHEGDYSYVLSRKQ